MSSNPLVSIILPTYNGNRFIEQSIQSCFEQRYQNWELIIVDDASTDNTPEIIGRYLSKDERISSIRHDKNRKLPGALNTGFSQAKGNYLTWTSDDNYYHPSAISEMVNFLELHPEIDIVYTDYTVIDEEGETLNYIKIGGPENIYLWNCIGPCFLYRRAVQEKLKGYAEDLFLAEDHDFWLRATTYFTAQPLHEGLYFYRNHKESLTTQKKEKILRVSERVFKRHLPNIPGLKREVAARTWVDMSMRALAVNNVRAARKYLLYAIVCSPAFVYRNHHDLLIINRQLAEKDQQLAEKDQQLAEKDQQLAEKYRQLAEKDQQLAEKDQQLAEKDWQLAEKDRYVQRLLNSYSWKITAPLRMIYCKLLPQGKK